VLGPELYLWGAAAQRRYDHTSLALPIVRRLAQETGESAFYSVRRADETVCMVREDGSFPLRSHVLYEGVRFPLGVASAGTAILAFLSASEIDEFFARSNLDAFGAEHSEAAVRTRLTQTRRTGWAVNPGLIVEGSWGMAAAVFGVSGAPVGALSLTGVEHRFSDSRRPDLGRRLLRAAHELTSRLRQPEP
jgi:DNA-binding IclR family transcriptional regulator